MLDELATLLTETAADAAEGWDLAGEIPVDVLRGLGAKGVLCAEVRPEFGGLGLSGLDNGRLAAHANSLCGSLRSVMTSQGMAAWTIQRFGTRALREEYLSRLTGGALAAVAFSEADAGSDLSAMTTEVRRDGDDMIVDGVKTWITAAAYADLVVVFGRHEGGGAVAVVPVTAPGVRVEPVPSPMGCRAAGHSTVVLDSVRVPPQNVLAVPGQSLTLLTSIALTYGRLSVAWGCVGILRACLAAAAGHARTREQFGTPLARHQLVARHLTDLYAAERIATQMCEHASRAWDGRSPGLVMDAILAKYVAAGNAARGAASAVQVLASAGARDGHVVARAYRDAKLMEIIEGSTEICQLTLAEHALAVAS
ncbi:acyl-CoA dehydrogenase family protein [Sphaerisporangium sp. TRM90804]|uniref:acyl-CoA dehydrogenase family protein n=1 Tax=Sphaerisporangium sp. TRM90804 TaxID=3031113 RepID=UPI00244AA99B|nr:acyl-CoA dehydrogenase family protein [Sphaerisporangium sp. TRM90804]MDH2428415.1 acyl-CoA dehydrogenase family protein [Sphaerisporangium sp. TRM90804]